MRIDEDYILITDIKRVSQVFQGFKSTDMLEIPKLTVVCWRLIGRKVMLIFSIMI
jgi:hypothetical protein